MRIFAALPLFLLVQLLPAQPCHSAYSTVPDRTYHLLRETEDWSFLRNPALRTDFWDQCNGPQKLDTKMAFS
jgi:hypothetical protein